MFLEHYSIFVQLHHVSKHLATDLQYEATQGFEDNPGRLQNDGNHDYVVYGDDGPFFDCL